MNISLRSSLRCTAFATIFARRIVDFRFYQRLRSRMQNIDYATCENFRFLSINCLSGSSSVEFITNTKTYLYSFSMA